MQATCIFRDVEEDAYQTQDHASYLQSFMLDPNVSWQAHAEELESMRSAINDMEGKIAQLQAIRDQVAPWQRSVIDEIAKTSRLIVDNAQDAIITINSSHVRLDLPPYRNTVNNLFDEAKSVKHDAGEAVEYANVSQEYRTLGHELGARPAS